MLERRSRYGAISSSKGEELVFPAGFTSNTNKPHMKNPLPASVRSRARQGFTLLELVVVVAVLVILAGILLPKFDVFKLKANKGVAASNMTDVSRIIQTYYVQYGVYPDKWDSLMTSNANGALWKAVGVDDIGLEPQLTSSPVVGPEKLTTVALNDGDIRSLTRIGITTVVDAIGTDGAPNDRFGPPAGEPVVASTPAAGTDTGRLIGTGTFLAGLNITENGAAADDEDAANIRNFIYPDGMPVGKHLVVLGFGTRNTAAGALVQEVPFYPNTDVTKYYSRFLAVFAVGGGSRAELKAVVGSDGDMIKEELADYYER